MASKLDYRYTSKAGQKFAIRHDGTKHAALVVRKVTTTTEGFEQIDSAGLEGFDYAELMLELGKKWSDGKAFKSAYYEASRIFVKIPDEFERRTYYRIAPTIFSNEFKALHSLKNIWELLMTIDPSTHLASAETWLLELMTEAERVVIQAEWFQQLVYRQARADCVEGMGTLEIEALIAQYLKDVKELEDAANQEAE